MNKKNIRKALFSSVVALLLCVSMLVGTTFAWFTEVVASENNSIKTGSLDIGLYWTRELDGANTVWHDAEDAFAGPIFNYRRWEPGHTEVRYVKVVNHGDLAFKYLLDIIPNGHETKLAQVIDVYYAEAVTESVATRDDLSALTKVDGTLADLLRHGRLVAQGVLYPEGAEEEGYYSGELVLAIGLKMQHVADNAYQGLSLGEDFDIRLRATQITYEEDSFDDRYDEDAYFPGPYYDITTDRELVIDEKGKHIRLRDVEGNYLSSVDGQKITLSNASFSGETLAFYLGRYGSFNYNTELNNVTFSDLTVTNGVVNLNDYVSPAVYVYGHGVLNNCVMSGTKNTSSGYKPYDLGITNRSVTTINGGSYGSIYVWSQAKVFLYGAKVDRLVSAAITYRKLGELVIGAGTEVNTIVLTAPSYKPALTIEEGAIVHAIVYKGVTYTVEEWEAFKLTW